MTMDVAHTHAELLDRLSTYGWSLNKLDLKNGVYVAKGEGPTGNKVERDGRTPEMALANLVTFAARHNQTRQLFNAASVRRAAWQANWFNQSEEIAKAYAQLPIYDEKAESAWHALAAETKKQAETIRQQITVELVDEPEPYLDAQEMREDIHKNRHLKVSRVGTDHPVWRPEQVIDFRIVHDVLGFAQGGGKFSWAGENMATAVHMPHVSPLAREALFVETIAQAAHVKHFRSHPQPRIALMSEFLKHVQDQEGEHVNVPHGGIVDLHSTPDASQMTPALVTAKNVSDNLPHDPNHYWSPPLDRHEIQPQVNPSDGMDGHRDYIGMIGAIDNASKIDTEWWEKDPETQDMAIINAFRVALLSPRKHLKWNAAHYQAIMHAHPQTKATDLWHTLEQDREKHNNALGYEEGSHLSYRKQLTYLTDMLEQRESLSHHEATVKAKQIVYEKIREFEHLLGEDDDEGRMSEMKRYNKARAMTHQWLKEHYSPLAKSWAPGQHQLFEAAHAPEGLFDADEWHEPGSTKDMTGFASEDSKYGAFMGAHLDGIEQAASRIDEIRSLALRDIEEDGGRGFIFRNGVMNMNLNGVNPKVASFAWLLLRPTTSELGIVDTHILRGLHLTEDDATPKDYYKIERMQRTARDATGYQHVPLGVYHWAMWDMIRNPGQHSDHAPLRILDPQDWREHDWDDATSAANGTYRGPEPFEAVRPLMARSAAEFDTQFGHLPKAKVPDPRKAQTMAHVLADSEKEKFRKLKSKLNSMSAEQFGFYAALKVEVTERQLDKFLDGAGKDFHHSTFSRFVREVKQSYSEWHEGGPLVLRHLM